MASLETLDPQRVIFGTDYAVTSIIYEGLTCYGENNEVLPCLADNWEVKDGGHTYIINIRQDVYFHDDPCFTNGKGRNLTADDIIFTFHRMANWKINCPNFYLFDNKIEGISEYHHRKVEYISGIKKLNDYQVEINLTSPIVSFIKLLATPSLFIVPKEAIETYGRNISHRAIGTGAFHLVKWRQLKDITLLKNDRYWKKGKDGRNLPYIDGIQVKLISNPVKAVSEFLKGELHYLTLSSVDYEKHKNNKDFYNHFYIAGKTYNYTARFWGFSMDGNSITSKNRELRRSIAHCFDREKIYSEKIVWPYIANTLVPGPLINNFNPAWYVYHPDSAKSVVAGCLTNYKEKNVVFASNVDFKEVGLMEQALNHLDLHPKKLINKLNYYREIKKDHPDLIRISFKPNYPDPEGYYALFYSKSSKNINLTGYKNSEFDAVYEKALIETNPENRIKHFYKMENILKEDVAAIYFSNYQPMFHLLPNNIKGVKINYILPDFSEIWMNRNNETSN